jgi:hypothetical protein
MPPLDLSPSGKVLTDTGFRGVMSGLATIQAQPQSKTLGRLEGPPPLFRLNRRLSALWSASPGSALGGQQRTRTPGSISLTENSEIQPDPSPY